MLLSQKTSVKISQKNLSLERYFHKEMTRVQAEWYGQQAAGESGIPDPPDTYTGFIRKNRIQ